MNIRNLSEYISDTKFGFGIKNVTSTTGYRIGGSSQYAIEAHDIKCDKIYVVNDCFLNIDGNIEIISYIPSIKYFLISKELSKYYRKAY